MAERPAQPERPERLQKLLAKAGVASRRAAEKLIRAGRVTVNGRRAKLGESAHAGRDAVAVDGRPVSREKLDYWVVHKPRGVLTTMSDPQGRDTVVELLPQRAGRLFPVGRLDRDTEGLVLLTNDGALAHVLLHPSFGKQREYRVTVRGRVLKGTRGQIERGVDLEEGRTARARVPSLRYDARSDATTFGLILTEGKKRQIRRMLRALGHPVVRLVRIRMGPIRLGTLEAGRARRLTADERKRLEKLRDSAVRTNGPPARS